MPRIVAIRDQQQPQYRKYLLLSNDKVLASARTRQQRRGDARVISDLHVEPEYRNIGLGRLIMSGILEREPRPVALRVGAYGEGDKPNDEQLTKFYASLGFEQAEGGYMRKAAIAVTPALRFVGKALSVPGYVATQGAFDVGQQVFDRSHFSNLAAKSKALDDARRVVIGAPDTRRQLLRDRTMHWLSHPIAMGTGAVTDAVRGNPDGMHKHLGNIVRDAYREVVPERSIMDRYLATKGGARKEAVVVQRDGKWQLLTKDRSRVLGTHDTAQEAYKQEYAIQKSQERNVERVPHTADKVSALGAGVGALAGGAAGYFGAKRLSDSKKDKDRPWWSKRPVLGAASGALLGAAAGFGIERAVSRPTKPKVPAATTPAKPVAPTPAAPTAPLGTNTEQTVRSAVSNAVPAIVAPVVNADITRLQAGTVTAADLIAKYGLQDKAAPVLERLTAAGMTADEGLRRLGPMLETLRNPAEYYVRMKLTNEKLPLLESMMGTGYVNRVLGGHARQTLFCARSMGASPWRSLGLVRYPHLPDQQGPTRY